MNAPETGVLDLRALAERYSDGFAVGLPEEIVQLKREIRRFIEAEVEPRSRRIEEDDAVPDDLLRMSREMGLFGLTIPEQYGGIGLDLAGKCAIEEELGRTNYGWATIIANHTGISTKGIVDLGNDEQKQRYLPRMATGEWIGCFALTEPQAGSDPAAMRTTAVRRGDRWILNGEKIYITNAPAAQVFTVMAVTDRAKGAKGISAFIVERGFPGLSVGPNERKMGMHGCGTAPVIMQDCEVPAENLLGPEGLGYVQALKTLTSGRVTVAARCCGIMDRLIERTIDYLKTREQGGQTLANYQGLQWMLADMALARDASRLLVQRAIDVIRSGARGTVEASMAKLHATEAAGRVADAAIQLHGGIGYMRDFGIETMARDVRITRIYEGTSEIQRSLIARELLKD
jgi:acyl-CoA dehydrogenase